jgi:hypothetical protein
MTKEICRVFLLPVEGKLNAYDISKYHGLGSELEDRYAIWDQVRLSKVELKIAPTVDYFEGKYVIINKEPRIPQRALCPEGTSISHTTGIMGIVETEQEVSDRIYRFARGVALKLAKQPVFDGKPFEFIDLVDSMRRRQSRLEVSAQS